MSRMATRDAGEEAYSDKASCTLTDDFPTPPFPDRTMIIFLTLFNLSGMSGFIRDGMNVSNLDKSLERPQDDGFIGD